MGKIEMRIVRETNNQTVVNIPASVKEALVLKGGDVVVFTLDGDNSVKLTKIDEDEFMHWVQKERD